MAKDVDWVADGGGKGEDNTVTTQISSLLLPNVPSLATTITFLSTLLLPVIATGAPLCRTSEQEDRRRVLAMRKIKYD